MKKKENEIKKKSSTSNLRVPDGTVYWTNLKQIMYNTHPNTLSWNFDKWLDALSDASDRVRFDYCLDPHGELQYIRAIQGHSGVPRIAPKFSSLLEIPCAWKVHIYHTGSSDSNSSIVEGGLNAGGTSDRRGRQRMLLLSCGSIGGAVARFHRIHHGRTPKCALQTLKNFRS